MRSAARHPAILLEALAMFLLAGAVSGAGLTVTPDANPVEAGTVVTLTIDPKVVAPGDHVTFDYGDGSTGEIPYATNCGFFGGCGTITHAWAGPGSFVVIASGSLNGINVSASVVMTVTGVPVSRDLYIPTGAHIEGLNSTLWRTDIEVHNQLNTRASFTMALLPRGGANPAPVTESFTLGGGHSQQYPDVVSQVFHHTGGAAIRFTTDIGSVMVTSRTYNETLQGTYGQQVPAIPVSQSIKDSQEARLVGLHHRPSLQGGYRTNIGLVNTCPAEITVHLVFLDKNGLPLGAVGPIQLFVGEYKQFDRAFEMVTTNEVVSGVVRLETSTIGGTFVAFASVIDNVTGDAVLVTPQLVE